MEKVAPVIEESWKQVLGDEFDKPYFSELKAFLLEEKKKFRVFPPGKMIFNAFNHTPFMKVKVVLLGQDPYHGYGQAHGLCFLSRPECRSLLHSSIFFRNCRVIPAQEYRGTGI